MHMYAYLGLVCDKTLGSPLLALNDVGVTGPKPPPPPPSKLFFTFIGLSFPGMPASPPSTYSLTLSELRRLDLALDRDFRWLALEEETRPLLLLLLRVLL